MAPFRLTCLGPPVLYGPDGDPIRFRTRKHFALLIYLAVEPGIPHRRDRLATLLWGGAEVDEARHSLATALSMIRGRLGADLLEAERESVRLVPGRILTDLQELRRDEVDADDEGPLGPFLEEFDIPDATDYQQWKDGQHARVLPSVHSAVALRIERCRRRGDSRRMEALGHRLQRIDELSEEAARALLEARAMAGDRIGALRLFDRWRHRLADELGALPSPQLERMAERLRRGGLPRPTMALLAPVPTEQWKERLFIGRGVEFGACYDRWERVQRGEPRHLLIRGESGIGKTTLVERLTTSVALEGASVARVQCYELERELPFGVTGSLVNLLLDLPGASATPPEQLA
jgi:DNA-binding SARP family transcriptional activator